MTTPIPSADTLESFHKELDEIRDDLMAKVGEEDARYIRRIVRVQRFLELGGRAVMVAGFYIHHRIACATDRWPISRDQQCPRQKADSQSGSEDPPESSLLARRCVAIIQPVNER